MTGSTSRISCKPVFTTLKSSVRGITQEEENSCAEEQLILSHRNGVNYASIKTFSALPRYSKINNE
jgi:hypothetical protein